MGGLFLLLVMATIIVPVNNQRSQAFGVSDIVNGTNQARANLNKSAYTSNALLMSAAQMKAEDMAKQHFFAHTAPDGTVAWDYFKKVGYTYSVAGENLAITNQDASAVINGWLNSPTHRDNLLNDSYTDLGIGMANYGDYQGHPNTIVIVAFYGKRATGQQQLTAATSPAGGTTNLKPQIPITPIIGVTMAILLIIAGVTFELRHIHRLHRGAVPTHR